MKHIWLSGTVLYVQDPNVRERNVGIFIKRGDWGSWWWFWEPIYSCLHDNEEKNIRKQKENTYSVLQASYGPVKPLVSIWNEILKMSSFHLGQKALSHSRPLSLRTTLSSGSPGIDFLWQGGPDSQTALLPRKGSLPALECATHLLKSCSVKTFKSGECFPSRETWEFRKTLPQHLPQHGFLSPSAVMNKCLILFRYFSPLASHLPSSLLLLGHWTTETEPTQEDWRGAVWSKRTQAVDVRVSISFFSLN